MSADTPATSRPRFWILAIVDPFGKVSGVGSGPLGAYEASGLSRHAAGDAGALGAGCGVGASDGSGVGV